MGKHVASAEFAHDLKVPIQLIFSCVQLLEREKQLSERGRDYLHTLSASASQLQNMVQRSLDGGDGAACLRDIVADARCIARQFDLLARRKGVRMGFRENVSAFRMAVDGEKLRRILHNLLSNALSHTPAGGSVTLELRLLGDAVEFIVSDTGCGIPRSMQEAIFLPGVTTGGTGYGLPIARRYAGELGGSVSVESTMGLGSRFTLRLPVGAAS